MDSKIINRLKRISVNYHRFGLIPTIKYVFYNGFIKRIINRINYITKSKKYPQNVIFITSLPKSGSTWLSNMCAEVDGFALFAPSSWNTYIANEWDDTRWDLTGNTFKEFRHNLVVMRGHTWAIPQNIKILKSSKLKYIIGIRDPRDKLISEYYHSRNFPGHWAHDEAQEKTLSEFITLKIKSGDFEKESIEWIRMWIKNRDKENSIIIKYEDLLNDTQKTITKIFQFLEFRIDKNTISQIVDKHSFRNVTGRDRGKSDDTKFVRKGVSGEWKTTFNEVQKKLFTDIGEDIIISLGYEPTFKNG